MTHQRILVVSSCLFLLSTCSGLGQSGGSNSYPAGKSPNAFRNPFVDVKFFVNPSFVEEAEISAKESPQDAERIRKAASYPSALWLDSIAATKMMPGWLAEAKKQQDANGVPTLSVYVVYDMPNRDCASKSSAGELLIKENGEARYRTEFIDPIAEQFKSHPELPIVVILEPDSLANLVTNTKIPACSDARQVYRNSVAYAINKLQLPNVSIYLDAAHSGWLGWDNNREGMARVVRQVLKQAGGVDKIRGFATNVSNYTHLNNKDGAGLEPTDPCPNELTYVHKMSITLSDFGIKGKGFVIDTSRNGRGGIRHTWGNWCNIKGAGLGERPRANPEQFVDAYFWIKPPGESDGTSDSNAPRFDPDCRSVDSAQNAPQAGKWFSSYFIDLVRNATPPL